MQSSIEEGVRQKRDILADIVETERQIMLWERKIELEKEMQEMLDPTVGEGVVQNMRKEIHRMELRHAELLRTQEQLMQVWGVYKDHCKEKQTGLLILNQVGVDGSM